MTNLFYGMQSKFQNKVVLLKKTWSLFYSFPERIFSSIHVIRIFINLDERSLRISPD
jgi:hypothetical protein